MDRGPAAIRLGQKVNTFADDEKCQWNHHANIVLQDRPKLIELSIIEGDDIYHWLLKLLEYTSHFTLSRGRAWAEAVMSLTMQQQPFVHHEMAIV